jgi:hypothetical protein
VRSSRDKKCTGNTKAPSETCGSLALRDCLSVCLSLQPGIALFCFVLACFFFFLWGDFLSCNCWLVTNESNKKTTRTIYERKVEPNKNQQSNKKHKCKPKVNSTHSPKAHSHTKFTRVCDKLLNFAIVQNPTLSSSSSSSTKNYRKTGEKTKKPKTVKARWKWEEISD